MQNALKKPLIVGEVREGARSIVEQLLVPLLKTLSIYSAVSARYMEDARARGNVADEALYEAEADYFTNATLDLLGILGRHVPEHYKESYEQLKEDIENKRGAIQ